MKRFPGSSWMRSVAVWLMALAFSNIAAAGTPYVVTNDDSPFPFLTGVSFYAIGAGGLPVFQQQVLTGGFGIGGGFFGMNRIAVLNTSDQQCVYSSEAGNGDIAGISIKSLTVGGSATGSSTDAGTSNGIGLAMNSGYLYASFSDSNTIGTFAVEPGCGLTFIGDTSVAGLHGGIINSMAVHGTMLVAVYTDGAIESFDISAGTPLSHHDKQLSTATTKSVGAKYPNSVDITSDGHYAIFGDTGTSLGVEISDLSAGKLSKTVTYASQTSISSSNLLLSPDETLLYVVNTQGATVSALFFDKSTGKVSTGCTSGRLSGLSDNFSYLAGLVLVNQTGNGGGVYVAEFGSSPAIATVTLSLSNQKCTLQESSGSPAFDAVGIGLLSIGAYPPRSF